MSIYTAGELNLLDLDYNLLLFRFLSSLVTLKAELAVLYRAADRRRGVRHYHHEVNAVIIGIRPRVLSLHDAELFVVDADKTHLCRLYLVVDWKFVLVVSANCQAPPFCFDNKKCVQKIPYA